MPPYQSVKIKVKVRWSNLYSFSCLRPHTEENHAQLFGGPGFSRVIFCNQSHLHGEGSTRYPTNYVSTTRNNFVTFLPKALFEQFRRVANLYFLLTAILSVTSVTPFSPGSVITPLVLVVGISMAKEAVEDWHRFAQDTKVNSRTVKVHVGSGTFMNKHWKELHVGDVVKVEKDQFFPSDLLLLSSSYDDGICYVETTNLDGETSLKLKRCLEVTLGLDTDMEFTDFKATIRCEDPNPNLYSFIGNLEYESQVYALSPCQVLLRDSKLRNTEYIYGVVVFSGRETKAVQNSTKSPSKRSHIERKMDYIIYILFSILVLMSLVSAVGTCVSVKFGMEDWWYVELNAEDLFFNIKKPGLSGLLQLIRSLILYGYLIPISLYVSIEIVKVLQAILINRDIAMYDEETCKSTEARTSNLNEDLGQVEIILSDKTGTLTCNQMEFRNCSVAAISYGEEASEVDIAASKRINLDVTECKDAFHGVNTKEMNERMSENFISHLGKSPLLLSEHAIKGFNFKDDRLMNMNWIKAPQVSDIATFLRVLALCHTGIPVEQDVTGKFRYEAESPEEVSFLVAAQELGFTFYRRTQSTIILKEPNLAAGGEIERQYRLLNLLEFSSSRKRMSVIVRDEDGQIFLLSKGADSIIYDRLAKDGKSYLEATRAHISDYAENGLRTLAIAYRRLEPVQYEKWNFMFTKAKTTVGPERDELLESASEMIEKDLILLGAVAIEDKLQKGVPECIDRLSQAGLKIWLLTGDKKETAINIGFSCSLLQHDMKQFHLGNASKPNSNMALKEEIQVQIETAHEVINQDRMGFTPFALIVDGEALELILHSDLKISFLALAVNCASVICCRVSPKQKALITKLVKKHTGMTTLAIGDGANDVGMIHEADIGVGISGTEGMQAVMASDFSLPKFHMLERLLVVHGHWCYMRITKMILYFVYKNIAFGMTLFYYEISTRFSGAILYDDWYLTLFNVVLTSLPVISIGVLDQDVSSDLCLQFPALYQQGQRNIYFSWTRVVGWIVNALFTSLVTFILNIYIFIPAAFQHEGQVADASQLGTIMYTCIILTVNFQMALITSHFTWIQHLFIWGSISLWYIFLVIYGSLPVTLSKRGFHLLSETIGPTLIYWLATIIVIIVCLLPYFIHISIQRWFFPTDGHIVQEMKHCKKDVNDNCMWERELKNSREGTHVGFSARVDAKVLHFMEHLHQKKCGCLNP